MAFHPQTRTSEKIGGQLPGRALEPAPLRQEQGGGVEQDGGLVEGVFQRHNAHAGTRVQPASVEVIALHGNRTGREGGNIPENAEEDHLRCRKEKSGSRSRSSARQTAASSAW